MKKTIILALFFSLFAGSLFFLTPLAQAQNPLDLSKQEGFNDKSIPQAFGQTTALPNDPRTIIGNIIQVALGFLATIFLVLMVYAGFKWMTAAGNEDQAGEAKKLITQAIIGLMIVLAAYSITYFVIKSTYEKGTQIKIL